jgi:glycerophosphoryl diester phosphodiesterase
MIERLAAVAAIGLACSGRAERGATAPLAGIVAHRGASFEAPENTLAALRRAWELGAESSEIDVRVSADGVPVLMHDETTARTTGVDRAVRDQTLAELRGLDAGAWKGDAYRGEPVPTLEEALATVPAGRMLFVEIKTGAAEVEPIAAAILAADPRPRGGDVALQAYDPDALAAAARRLPGVPAYWTVDPPYTAALVDAALARGFHGLALDHRGVDDALAEAIAAAGLVLDVWTIDDPDTIAAWRRRGARWIETNRPDLAAR